MLIAAITLLLTGAALLTRGLIGRRVGEEPRCRKCKYNLTGVESKECPECGRPWTIESTPKGLRHRQKLPIALGCLLIVAAGALEAPATRRWVSRQNFYDYVPARLALFAATHGSQDALTSIMRRYQQDRLSQSQIKTFVDAALDARFNTTPGRTIDALWIDATEQLILGGAFTNDQAQRLFAVNLRVRQKVRQGDPVPFSISLSEARPCYLGFEATIEPISIESENHWIGSITTTGQPEPLQEKTLAQWNGLALPDFNAGSRSLTFKFSYSVSLPNGMRFRPRVKRLPGPVLATHLELTRAIDVVAPELDSVEAIESPQLADQLKKSLFANVAISGSDAPNETKVEVELVLSAPLPQDLAAEVILEDPKGYLALPGVQVLHANKVGNQGSKWLRTAGAFRPGDLIHVRLKSNRELARKTIDIFKVLECDIVLGPVQARYPNGRDGSLYLP